MSDLSNLAWTARGGNTLLCANPPQWASTVASHKNWRVIEQEKVVTLHELIGRFSDWNGIPKLFEDIAKQRIQNNLLIPGPKPKWTGKIKLLINATPKSEPEKLAWNELDTGTLIVAPAGSNSDIPEPVFTVLNANGAQKADRPILKSLPIDYTLFLVTGTSYKRSSTQGNQTAGLYVNSLGQLKPERVQPNKINRFSFRLAGARNGPWKKHDTQPLQNLESGDLVNIYCHSLGVGPYANIDKPPNLAVPVLYLVHEKKLVVPVPEEYAKSTDVQSIVTQYDYGILTRKDRDAFEAKGYLDSVDRIEKIKQKKVVPALNPPITVQFGLGGIGMERNAGGFGASESYSFYKEEQRIFIPVPMEVKDAGSAALSSGLARFTVFFEAV